MNIITANSPVYLADGSITLTVQIDGMAGEVPFNATPNDTEAHGRDIYDRALAGEFGPIAPYIAPTETPEQIERRLTAAVQRHLDTTAQADGWDSIYTASLRAAFPGPWQAKGIAYATWMDACWVVCHQVEDAVTAGTRPVPTEAELIAELPGLVLP